MHPELVMDSGFERGASFWRSRRLHAFLAASLLAHAAIIMGFPDLLRGYATQGVSVLEVTLLAPQPQPQPAVAPEPVPEPQLVRPEPKPAPRPDAEKRQVESVAKPSGGGAVKGVPLPPEDPEIVGSFSVAPFRAPAPVTTLPDPGVEAAASGRPTPPSLDAAYLSNPPPRYPPAARRAGEQGIVTLRVLVLRSGLPSRVEIEKSSGSRLLDTAAQDAVWGWRFVPGRLGTDPVEQWMQVPVRFRLEDPQ
jgi:protein TonB